MALRENAGLGAWLAAVLALLTVVFVGVVYATIHDRDQMQQQLFDDSVKNNFELQRSVDVWADKLTKECARQLAAPFLWDFDTLEGVEEGTAQYNLLQQRMSLFMKGQPFQSAWHAPGAAPAPPPAGPLESIVVVDLHHRIVAATDPMVVDQEYTDPQLLRVLDAALVEPQIHRDASRTDGKTVWELSAAVPNSKGVAIGIVRLRYVGGVLTTPPKPNTFKRPLELSLLGPFLAGLLAVLGVGFGAIATYEVFALTRRMERMAAGEPPTRGSLTGVGARALSMIEEKLDALAESVKRDDMLVSSLTEALREGVILLDPDGKAVVSNRQAREVLGFADLGDAAFGQAFAALRRNNPEFDQVLEAGVHDRQAARDRNITLTTASGATVSIQLTAYVLADPRETLGMMLVVKDRASIATLERSLREASRLQAIVRLTGSVAHEVKNPLGAIGIHLEHLRRRLSRLRDADPLAEERVQVIRDEIGRLREVLEEWLRLTSPDERVPAQVPLSELLASVARLLRVEARHQHVELIVEQEGEPASAALAAPRLRQVLLNLCLNALQAMPDGGRLTIRAMQRGERVLLEVEDSGSGIPDAVRDRIFDVHFTTRPGGSGLGLAICKRIVEEANGTIEFESVAGQGTTFRLALPIASPGAVRRSVTTTETA